MSDNRRSGITSLGRAWPQSLFGRLVAACAIAVVLAQAVALLLIAHERERFVLQESVREWSRRIAEITLTLQPMDAGERAEATSRLIEQYSRFGRRALVAVERRRLLQQPALIARSGTEIVAGGEAGPGGGPGARPAGAGFVARGPDPGGADPGFVARGPGRGDAGSGFVAHGLEPAGGLHPDPGPRGSTGGGQDGGTWPDRGVSQHRGTPPSGGASARDAGPGPGQGAAGTVDGQARPGGPEPLPPDDMRLLPPRVSLPPAVLRPRVTILPLPLAGDFEHPLEQMLQSILGPGYRISVAQASGLAKAAIPVSPLQSLERRSDSDGLYDVTVQYPDGGSTLFQLARPTEGAPIPRNLFVNLSLLVVIMTIALYVTARTITLPLLQLARAADRVGRDVRQPKLEEKGAREIRNAAHAFNTMQDRMQRYLDSRTRVLAAMSHDLKTPLTRLRLQVETLEDPDAQARIGKQLDEMESMVRGALALFRGLDDDEALAPVDMNALLATLQSEFSQMGSSVTISGAAEREFTGKPQALKRCLTNLIENAIKFGGRARLRIEDGTAVVIRIEDDGPGIPVEELERVFEPFYRVESSRNRDSGGTGLGLSIARDIAQSHGGSLVLRNLPQRGLQAVLTLPRQG